MATLIPVTNNSGKGIAFEKVPCIHYLFQFQESQEKIKALLNGSSKINVINLTFTQKLDFYIQKTNIRAQKIISFTLMIFRIIFTNFQMKNNAVGLGFSRKLS